MRGFDWNGNGKRDHFDRFMDYKIMSEKTSEKASAGSSKTPANSEKQEAIGINFLGKTIYDARKDSDLQVTLKCFFVTLCCIGSIAIPVCAGMDGIGVIVFLIGGPLLALKAIKNV